jgi:putative ABC transport system permease protein
MSPTPLGPTDLVLAASLLLYALAISWRRGLGLEGTILWSALRALVQLSLLGLGLKLVIQANSPWVVCGVLLGMTLLGADAARRRVRRSLPGAWTICLAGIAAAVAGALPIVVLVIMRPTPWFDPRIVVPIGGLLVGSTMTGTAIALDRLLAEVSRGQGRIEAALALGATPAQAARSAVADATQASMIAPINNMVIQGLIQVPGVTVGLLLANVDPEDGVRYSLVVSYSIVSSVAITSTVTSALGARQLFTARGQLRREVLDSH